MPTAKEGGKHEADNLAQQRVLGLQAAFDLGHQGVRNIQVLKGLMKGFDIELGEMGSDSIGLWFLECLTTTAAVAAKPLLKHLYHFG
jgi:hypothetical protein